MTAFAGEFADLKLVKTRSVVQVVVELPIERFAELVAHFGPPGASTWVALARLHAPSDPPGKGEAAPSGEGRAAVKAAVLLCKDERFQRWMLGPFRFGPDAGTNELETIVAVRRALGVQSRAELNDPEKMAEWRAMVRRYEQSNPKG